MSNAALDNLRELIATVTTPGLDEAIRGARARTIADVVSDERDAALAMIRVAPGLVWSHLAREATEEDREIHATLGEFRALADFAGLDPRTYIAAGSTGLSHHLPLIRSVAEEVQAFKGIQPVVPGVVEGVAEGFIDATDEDDGTTLHIADMGDGTMRHTAGAGLEYSRQVVDFIAPEASGMLDQIAHDLADRAAERFIAETLQDAAGGTRTAGDDLGAALDEAEAATRLAGPGSLLIVNPVDLPRARTAVSRSWQVDPHPEFVVSYGATEGTLTVAGREAFALQACATHMLAEDKPATLARLVVVTRYFYVTALNPEGIQTVTLEA